MKKVSDTKVPPKKSIKVAKSKEDLEDEFEVIEIPIMMKEFEDYLKLNPGRSLQDFLEDNKKDLIRIHTYFLTHIKNECKVKCKHMLN